MEVEKGLTRKIPVIRVFIRREKQGNSSGGWTSSIPFLSSDRLSDRMSMVPYVALLRRILHEVKPSHRSWIHTSLRTCCCTASQLHRIANECSPLAQLSNPWMGCSLPNLRTRTRSSVSIQATFCEMKNNFADVDHLAAFNLDRRDIEKYAHPRKTLPGRLTHCSMQSYIYSARGPGHCSITWQSVHPPQLPGRGMQRSDQHLLFYQSR